MRNNEIFIIMDLKSTRRSQSVGKEFQGFGKQVRRGVLKENKENCNENRGRVKGNERDYIRNKEDFEVLGENKRVEGPVMDKKNEILNISGNENRKVIINVFSCNEYEKKEKIVKTEFLRKGQGSLCTRQRSLSEIPENLQKIHHKLSKSMNESREKITQRAKKLVKNAEDLKYSLLVKDLEQKIKEIDASSANFYQIREKEAKYLENWKKSQINLISQEYASLESLQKNYISQMHTIESLTTELTSLKASLSVAEKAFRLETLNLSTQISLLNSQNSNLKLEIPKKSAISRPKIPILPLAKALIAESHNIPTNTLKFQYPNGVKKETRPDGSWKLTFPNNDTKESFTNRKIIYNFFETNTIQTTFPDGLRIFEFSNGQVEKHFKNGDIEIKFADGTFQFIFNTGEEENVFPNGVVQKKGANGVGLLEYPDGSRDVIMPDGKRIRINTKKF